MERKSTINNGLWMWYRLRSACTDLQFDLSHYHLPLTLSFWYTLTIIESIHRSRGPDPPPPFSHWDFNKNMVIIFRKPGNQSIISGRQKCHNVITTAFFRQHRHQGYSPITRQQNFGLIQIERSCR